MSTENKVKVLYFAGSGRSGSTILNIILGNHPEVFGGGELQNMRQVYNPEKICSCQNSVIDCGFWSSIIKTWSASIDEKSIDEGLLKWREYEGVFSFRPWMRMLFGLGRNSSDSQSYLKNTTAFLKAVQQVSEKPVLVDISKNPLRAWALEKNPNIDLRMVHLVRDGRAVMWSLKRTAEKQNRKRPSWRASLFWAVINRMTNFVRGKVSNKIVIKYEDFTSDPETALREIGQMAEIDFSSIISKIRNNEDFHINHVMAGNGIRKAKTVKFQASKSTTSKKNLKLADIRLFNLLSFTSLKKFKYN